MKKEKRNIEVEISLFTSTEIANRLGMLPIDFARMWRSTGLVPAKVDVDKKGRITNLWTEDQFPKLAYECTSTTAARSLGIPLARFRQVAAELKLIPHSGVTTKGYAFNAWTLDQIELVGKSVGIDRLQTEPEIEQVVQAPELDRRGKNREYKRSQRRREAKQLKSRCNTETNRILYDKTSPRDSKLTAEILFGNPFDRSDNSEKT